MNLRSLIDWFGKDYDFYKGTVVSTGAATVVLLVLFVLQMSQASALTEGIRYGEQDLKNIYEMTDKIFAFNQELKGDPFAGSGNDISKPIQNLFYDAGLGSPTIKTRAPEKNGSVETVHYTITPEKDRSFTRSQIANFLQRLENSTTRARVTGIKLTPPGGKNITPGQRREDDWTGEIRVTTRRRVEAPK